MPANLPDSTLDALTALGLRVVRDRGALTYSVTDPAGCPVLQAATASALAAWVIEHPAPAIDRHRPDPLRDLGRAAGRAATPGTAEPTADDWRRLVDTLNRQPTVAETALYLDGWHLGRGGDHA